MASLDIDEDMQFLRANIPSVPGLQNLLDYFSATYVYGVVRPVKRPNAFDTDKSKGWLQVRG